MFIYKCIFHENSSNFAQIIIAFPLAMLQGIETLMGVQLPDDIGEWVCDGVVLCEVVNRLHPGLIPNINRPSSGVVSLS